MRKNAFTLVELLAVLVIIGIISAISIAIYSNSITDSKNALSEVQIKHLEESARTFVTINTIEFNNIFNQMTTNKCVAIGIDVLIAEGLISGTVVDPKDTATRLDGYIKVNYSDATHQYVYEYTDATVSSSTCSYKYWVENGVVKHTN